MGADSYAFLNIQIHQEVRALTAHLMEIDDCLFRAKEETWQNDDLVEWLLSNANNRNNKSFANLRKRSRALAEQIFKLQADKFQIQSQISQCAAEQKKIERQLEQSPNFQCLLFQRFHMGRA